MAGTGRAKIPPPVKPNPNEPTPKPLFKEGIRGGLLVFTICASLIALSSIWDSLLTAQRMLTLAISGTYAASEVLGSALLLLFISLPTMALAVSIVLLLLGKRAFRWTFLCFMGMMQILVIRQFVTTTEYGLAYALPMGILFTVCNALLSWYALRSLRIKVRLGEMDVYGQPLERQK